MWDLLVNLPLACLGTFFSWHRNLSRPTQMLPLASELGVRHGAAIVIYCGDGTSLRSVALRDSFLCLLAWTEVSFQAPSA